MKEKANSKEPENDNRLDAVRDLLFGPNDQAYRKEFKEIRDQLSQSKEEFNSKSEALESDILSRFEKLENKISEKLESKFDDLNAKIDALSHSKVDRKQLAELLQSIAKELEA
ncbi:MAG: hypothetical protein AAFY41_01510 [Bacteroidota bacterium]